jgi:hypothetical protein
MSDIKIRAYFANGEHFEYDPITGQIKDRPKRKPVKFYTGRVYHKVNKWSIEQGLYTHASATGDVRFNNSYKEQYCEPVYVFVIDVKADNVKDLEKLMTGICDGSIKPIASFDNLDHNRKKDGRAEGVTEEAIA